MANKSGGGSETNKGGLKFEDDVKELIMSQILNIGYLIEEDAKNKVYRIVDQSQNLIAIFGAKNGIFNWLNIRKNFEKLSDKFVPSKRLKSVWSKNLIPDFVMLSFLPEAKFHILEVKFQCGSGSIDEKLQTGKFKHSMWNKLFEQVLGKDKEAITYSYLLSNWFLKEPAKEKKQDFKYHYKAVFNFLDANNIKYYLNFIQDFKLAFHEDGKPKLDSKKKQKNEYMSVTPEFKDLDGNPFNIEDFLK